jgi:signal peptidase I
MDAIQEIPPKRRLPIGRVVAAGALAACVGTLVALGTWPPFATVMSASMEPTIKTGDVVVLKKLGRPPRVGDVIAVTVPDAARRRYGYPPTVVHRVVSVAPTGAITTKGDARPKPDPFTVSRTAVRARVVLTVPAAGQVFAFLTSTMGLLWLAAGVVLLIGLPLLERQRQTRQAEQDALAGLHDELRTMTQELAALRKVAATPPAPMPEPEMPEPEREPAAVAVAEQAEPFDFNIDWRTLEESQPFAQATEPPPQPVRGTRRSGGLVGRLERYARSSRYS